MKSFNMPAPVNFWRWISPNTIAIVTGQAVFHWSIEGNSDPVKVFDRNAALGDNTQIINYQVSRDDKWCLLCGISAGNAPGIINGNMQLFSVEKSVSQMLTGHSGVFTVVQVPGRAEPAQVLCFEKKEEGQAPKLYVMEVRGNKDVAGGVFRPAAQVIPMAPDAPNDFPVTMNASSKHALVYLITKMGYVFVFDIISCKAVHRARITQDTVIVSTINTESEGVLAVTRRGQMIHVCVNETGLVPAVVARDQELAIALAGRLNLPGADDIFKSQFSAKVQAGDIAGAAAVAGSSPRGFLRTAETIELFKRMTPQPGQSAPLFQYFNVLLEKGSLNQLESVELAKPVIESGRVQLLEKYVAEDKLELTEVSLTLKPYISLYWWCLVSRRVPYSTALIFFHHILSHH